MTLYLRPTVLNILKTKHCSFSRSSTEPFKQTWHERDKMLLSMVSRSPGIPSMLKECNRFVGTMCRVCTSRRTRFDLLELKPSPRSKSLNKDFVCLSVVPFEENAFVEDTSSTEVGSEVTMISVMNLNFLLELLSSDGELNTKLDRIYSARNSLGSNFSDADSDCVHLSNGNDSLALDGKQLDHIFGINQADFLQNPTEGMLPSVGPDSFTETNSHESLSFIEKLLQSKISFAKTEENHFLHEPLFNIADLVPDKNVPTGSPSCDIRRDSTQTLVNTTAMSDHVLCFDGGALSKSPKGPDDQFRPSRNELEVIQKHLNHYLPRAFLERHDYRIYTKDIVLENNFAKTPFVIQGINRYVRECAKYRIYAHMRYANVRMHVLKSTVHEEDGSVRIRWRVSGIPQVTAFMFWKFLPWKYRSAVDDESEWMDGFSTFYVQDKTGLICKHTVDRVIPDENKVVQPVGVNVGGAM